ncbi:ethanolamine utilization protein EutQ, partial [bacterium 210820-DFI.6.52]|nr:ethanolamine utilization protein EutQ [bacterium 210820-DFI.6.52]
GSENSVDFLRDKDESGVISIKLPTVKVDESNRLDTGNPSDVVYTKDLFTLEESPRLGCGIMEMKETTFDWT